MVDTERTNADTVRKLKE